MSQITLTPDDVATPSQPDYVLSPDVLLLPVDDGSARLLDLGGEVFSVSESGAMMLMILLERGTGAAVAEVARHFSANPSRVQSDLGIMLKDFQAKKLLRPVHAADPAPRRARQAMAHFLAFPLRLVLVMPLPLQARAAVLLTLARLSCALAGWTATIRAWERRTNPRSVEPIELATQIDQAVRAAAAKHLLKVACKERALSCWALARSAGLNAELVVGIQFFPVAGHCWCEVGDLPLSDDKSRISDFRPIARWI
jgi:hypothetical protein